MSARKDNIKKMDQIIFESLDCSQSNHHPDEEEYEEALNNAKKVVDLKNSYNSQSHEKIVKVVGAVSSIVCVGMMLVFERSNAITTKSLPFFPKPHI